MQIKATDLKIKEVLKEAKLNGTYWDEIDGIKDIYAEIESLEQAIADPMIANYLETDKQIDSQKVVALDKILHRAQEKFEELGGEKRYNFLLAEEKRIYRIRH